jgi:polyvinyl alcohol dehydrogenase (cytochrome)
LRRKNSDGGCFDYRENSERGEILVKKQLLLIGIALAPTFFASTHSASAQTLAGVIAFDKHCATCHGNPASKVNAPGELTLRKLTSDEIMVALTKGPHVDLTAPTDEEKFRVAEYIGGLRPGVTKITDAKLMSNQCSSNPPLGDLAAKPAWNGWGNEATSNARFQPASAAGITPAQASQLKLKWAFGFPGAEQVFGQPSVVAGRVFIGVDTGAVYSLDATTGCVYWSFQADAAVRNAISVGPVKGQGAVKYAAYFGDIRANVYALDANTGKLVWKAKVENHPVARVTGAPTLFEGRLYVPVSSSEERTAGYSSIYPCCTFRGSVLALDANNGRQIWKTYIVPGVPKPTTKTSKGVQQFSPNGGAVWNSPTIDPKRHALYIGTGDAYLPPAAKTTDAVVALDMASGKIMWAHQDTENDAWLAGCGSQNSMENCPKDLGPDYDFGASPILRTLPDGHRVLIAGQKSGMVWAHDPDQEGTVLWKAQLVTKLALGMITFGGAADDQNAYFGLRSGGIAAVQLTTGERRWFTPIEGPATPGARGENAALSAAPGVVFSDGWDGVVRAFSTDDGKLLWEYNTIRDYQTVNGVAARGGSMGASGPTIADGTLFVGSGYRFGVGTPGNVLLAFTPSN